MVANDEALESISVPISGSVAYDGTGDPAGGRWLLRDGRLIDKTTYAGYFNAVGHAFNGGVDPGANKVRIGDARGRTLVGADNMGTAQGAASRIVTAAATRGANAGSERITLAAAESGVAAHGHGVTDPGHSHQVFAWTSNNPAGGPNIGNAWTVGIGFTNPSYASINTGIAASVGTGVSVDAATPAAAASSHQNLQPSEFTNWITRVL